MIHRYSSRKKRLDTSFLTPRLNGAQAYDRIAGYFSSSLLEIAGEEIESVSGPVRIVCNSRLDPRDVQTARSAQAALLQEWCGSTPEDITPRAQDRFAKLGLLLTRKKIEVRVLPDESFGLIHGKAGVITLWSGSKTSFIGSVNESVSGWVLNYELLWEDDDPAAVAWVQSEFDTLWHHPSAYPLPEAVVLDIERIAHRKVYSSFDEWEKEPDPGPFIVEAPVSREQTGLWEHQKYFINLQNIYSMFGQLPDVLEDVWVKVALGEIAEAEQTINGVPQQHPFSLRYERPMKLIPWERCRTVLDRELIREVLKKGW
jgi:hypothetical protein